MRKLTIDEILAKIRSFAHDSTLSTSLIIDFINQALQDIQAFGDYNFQVIRDESVTIPAGTSVVDTEYPVKRIISVKPEDIELVIKQGDIHLSSAPTSDITITLDYIRTIPAFDTDETNNIFPDSDILIFGATYYALLYNMQPEFAKYEQIFTKRLMQFVEQNSFILPMPQVEDLQNKAI